jgi:hypothetical protein
MAGRPTKGRNGLPELIALAALRLLAIGAGTKQVAKRLGIARETVKRIARGKHCPTRAPFVRCPGCGGKVVLPCLHCQIESRRPSAQPPAPV